ncbi:MAG: CopD family protein [Elusimicrobia bacterium]|nr:CopD family protein [Elusimicrobiota bacterium]
MTLDLAAHWLHLLAAALWVGGNLAVALVVQPALRSALAAESRMAAYREIGWRFSILQWSSWAVLLGTGLFKLWGLRATPEVFAGVFGAILGAKLCLIAAMAVLSLLHAYRWGPLLLSLPPSHPAFQENTARMAFWGRVNAALLVGIIGLAAALRFNPW